MNSALHPPVPIPTVGSIASSLPQGGRIVYGERLGKHSFWWNPGRVRSHPDIFIPQSRVLIDKIPHHIDALLQIEDVDPDTS